MKHLFVSAIMLILGALLLLESEVYGQSSCPFPDSVAVADTLDPKGYYPVQVGNVWEYTGMEDRFIANPWREEIVSDTLIDGVTFYKLKSTSFDYDFSPVITRSFTWFSYIAVSDTGVVAWRSTGLRPGGPRFSQPFNSCFMPDGLAVYGGYGGSLTVIENDSAVVFALPATKSFTYAGGLGGSITYGHGIGHIRSTGDPNNFFELTYARIGEWVFGTPLDSLFTIAVGLEEESSIPHRPPRLQSYPNPFKTKTHLSFSLATPASVSLRIFDILGRVIAEPLANAPYASGTHTVTWQAHYLTAGMYFAQLIVDGRYKATSQILLIK